MLSFLKIFTTAWIHNKSSRKKVLSYHKTFKPIFHSSVPIGVPGATTGSMFTPVPVEILAYEPEAVGLDLLHKTKFTKLRHVEPIPDLARVSEGTGKLEMMLDSVIQV